VKQCQELPKLLNGRIVYSDERMVTDSKADYICDFSFKLNTLHHIRHCRQDDTWSELSDIIPPTFPRCLQVTCPVPARQHSGLRIINLIPKKIFKPGDIIIYSCHTGVRATSKCLPDGTWQRG
jgi:Sushi repeat (SCR repeat)